MLLYYRDILSINDFMNYFHLIINNLEYIKSLNREY